ncbi:MAG: hypothetical protein PHF56_18650 [Desulfuromonadaceae bacterium]|nr:hypothetical protein [Desulfuromonadaceae bacterium]
MKRLINRLALLVASLMIVASPVLADEGIMNSTAMPEQQGAKNECLLVARNCTDSVDTITERISRIQNEINKGSIVYTNDELRTLQNKLDDSNKTLNDLMQGGA